MNFTKKDYLNMAAERRLAFTRIAEALGNEHLVTKMMGSRAWGRNNEEQGMTGNLQTAIREVGYLDGSFDILNTWCRDNNYTAQRVLLELYPRGFSSAASPAKS